MMLLLAGAFIIAGAEAQIIPQGPANASINVRKTVQSCLALLASRTGSEVSELLEPLYQPLLQPLIMRPLRSKTVDQQVNSLANSEILS